MRQLCVLGILSLISLSSMADTTSQEAPPPSDDTTRGCCILVVAGQKKCAPASFGYCKNKAQSAKIEFDFKPGQACSQVRTCPAETPVKP